MTLDSVIYRSAGKLRTKRVYSRQSNRKSKGKNELVAIPDKPDRPVGSAKVHEFKFGNVSDHYQAFLTPYFFITQKRLPIQP